MIEINRKIYYFGGAILNKENELTPIDKVFIYRRENDIWEEMEAKMPHKRYYSKYIRR
ncbi:MAG: hypothetical protein MHPSP_003412, partial [Paramarteilia canceri]